MDLSNKKVLITGAAGFIGSHLTEYLLSRGARVRAFDLYNFKGDWGWLERYKFEKNDNLEVVLGDIRDPHNVKSAVHDCQIIFHLAALIGIPYSYLAPESYIETNIKGTLNVLQAAREHCVERVIQTSTSEVYGTAEDVPIKEQHPLKGQSPYAASKIGADQLAWSFFRSFNTPVVIVRPFNTFGPRQSARAVIPTIIGQLLRHKSTISLGSICPTRDFNFVKDIVRGFELAALSDSAVGEAINLGTGFEISIHDLAKKIGELMEHPHIEIIQHDERKRPQLSEVDRLCADNHKANSLLNWKPAKLGLEGLVAGLKETIEWIKNDANDVAYQFDRYNI